jgi:single-strand DNA-binding protein
VKKGDRLYVEGRIEYSQTEGDGGPKYWTDVVVNEMVMLGSTAGGSGGGGGGGGGGRSTGGYSGGGGGDSEPSLGEPDDDLPF